MASTTGNLKQITNLTEEGAREMLEALRWPNGAICPRCGADRPYKLAPKADSKRPVRPGVWKCRAGECRKQFTVTVGTVMERSHIPLKTWLLAFHLMSSSKKGFSAHQMHRNHGIDLKSAWFLAHRIREAMKREPLAGKLGGGSGDVEADETYVGGRPRAYEKSKVGRPGRDSKKVCVVALVERGGDVRSFPMANRMVTGTSLRVMIREQVATNARLFTDELNAYEKVGKEFADHQTVVHSEKEYVRGEAHVNTVEGFFSILKRGVNGVYHHVSRQHLGRYLSEFDFRYNGRKLTDGERTALAIRGAEGRRLTYRQPAACPAR